MFRIHGRFVMRMAGGACEHCEVGRIGVAVGARGPFALVRARINGEPGVVENSTRPTACVVTGGARGRECRSHVVWVCHTGVVSFVARVTIRRGAGILAADVTVRTLHRYVRSRQREGSLAVVEVRGRPGRGAMANFARLREACRDVIRVGRVVKVREMARITERAQPCVFAAGVASHASLAYVSTGQREERLRVVEDGACPTVRGMANRTVGRESGRGVIRVRGLLEIDRVTTGAILRRTCKAPVDVALRALHADVGAG